MIDSSMDQERNEVLILKAVAYSKGGLGIWTPPQYFKNDPQDFFKNFKKLFHGSGYTSA